MVGWNARHDLTKVRTEGRRPLCPHSAGGLQSSLIGLANGVSANASSKFQPNSLVQRSRRLLHSIQLSRIFVGMCLAESDLGWRARESRCQVTDRVLTARKRGSSPSLLHPIHWNRKSSNPSFREFFRRISRLFGLYRRMLHARYTILEISRLLQKIQR